MSNLQEESTLTSFQDAAILMGADFMEAFEDMTLALESFSHEQHVRLAYVYLEAMPLARAVEAYTTGLKALTVKHGLTDKYHETISWFFMVLINERMERAGGYDSFAAFKSDNPDLFEKDSGILGRYYPPDVLTTDYARRVFILPSLS
ncbi:hypothetical protein GCM10017044_03250 [Kordiimonas sediminis]|uniref:Uncharacterized protein n=1 Tax=Kordiimonas sediminis TaxID=1735581 RepID=A0A919AM87_9PROT|nr:hypothetical protein [Kordiimonas sediminis]GHF12635.1 hypothetical protein GCM10017044_03250 [Kordiimonas sediminis]